MFLIEIDETSLEWTAQALAVVNPGRASADHMRGLARSQMQNGSTSLGTGGWEATGYFPQDRPGVMVVRFSVSAYSILRFLETLPALTETP